jgi:hypothetical protein
VDGRGHGIEHQQLPDIAATVIQESYHRPRRQRSNSTTTHSDGDGGLCFGHVGAEHRDSVPYTRPAGSEPDLNTAIHGLQPPVD